MNKNANKGRFCSKEAFTLIELLVVIVIIAILAAVALPQYQKAVLKSRYTQALVLGKHIAEQKELFFLENGFYPSTWEQLGMSAPNIEGWDFILSQNINVYARYKNGASLRFFVKYPMSSSSLCTEDRCMPFAGKYICTAQSSDTEAIQLCQSLSHTKEGKTYTFVPTQVYFDLN